MFGYDIKQATTYFFQDEGKATKLIVLYILAFINVILNSGKFNSPYMALLIIPMIYFYGYLAKNNNCRILKSQSTLPELNDWRNYLLIGLKNLGGIIIYTILFFVITGIAAIPAFLAANNFAIIAISIVFMIVGIIFCILLIIAIQIAFSVNLKFKSMFDSKLLKQIMFKNYKPFMQLVSVAIVLGICNAIIMVLLALTIVGILLIPLVLVYLFLIMSDLYGQFISKSIKVNEG